jgi:hypothetical protein
VSKSSETDLKSDAIKKLPYANIVELVAVPEGVHRQITCQVVY